MIKHRYTRFHIRGMVTHTFCDGKFHLSEEDKRMYRAFGRLYRLAEQAKKKV